MVLPASGALSFSQLQTEFGGTDPIDLTDYYRGGGRVPDSVAVNKSGTVVTSASDTQLGSTNMHFTASSKSATGSGSATSSGNVTITGSDDSTAATIGVSVSGANSSLNPAYNRSFSSSSIATWSPRSFQGSENIVIALGTSFTNWSTGEPTYVSSVGGTPDSVEIQTGSSYIGLNVRVGSVSIVNAITSITFTDSAGQRWVVSRSGARQDHFPSGNDFFDYYALSVQRLSTNTVTLSSIPSSWGTSGTLTYSGSSVTSAGNSIVGYGSGNWSYSSGTKYDYDVTNNNAFALSVGSTSVAANSSVSDFSQGNTGSISVTVTGTDPMTYNDSIPTSGNNAPISLSDFYGARADSPLNA